MSLVISPVAILSDSLYNSTTSRVGATIRLSCRVLQGKAPEGSSRTELSLQSQIKQLNTLAGTFPSLPTSAPSWSGSNGEQGGKHAQAWWNPCALARQQ